MLRTLLTVIIFCIASSGVIKAQWDGKIDAIVYDSERDKYYLFNGSEYIRHSWNEVADEGYPRSIRDNWVGWPSTWGYGDVDAVVYDSKRDAYYLFKGTEYVRHDWNQPHSDSYPRSIKEDWKGWPTEWGDGYVDAVVYDEDRDVYYLFKDSEYVRHTWNKPRNQDDKFKISPLTNWSGLNGSGATLDAATYDSNRDIYYIFNSENRLYVRHKWNHPMDENYPKNTALYWAGYQGHLGNKQLTYIIASDPQYFFARKEDKNKSRSARMELAEKHIKNSVKAMNEDISAYNVKGVIINGDITRHGEKEEMDKITSLLSPLKAPYYPGLGNHDLPFGERDPSPESASRMFGWVAHHAALAGITNTDVRTGENLYRGSLAYSWNDDQIHFVQLQENPGFQKDWEYAGVNYQMSDALPWLTNDMQLANRMQKRSIINYHIPQAIPYGYSDIFRTKGVVGIFTGHTDYFGLRKETPGPYNPIPIFESNAMFRGTYFLVTFYEYGYKVTSRYSDPDMRSKKGREWVIMY